MMKYDFLGAGRMATALAAGMVKSGCEPSAITAYDVSEAALSAFAQATGAAGAASPAAFAGEVLILAVKPQVLAAALQGFDASQKLIVSIVAGVTLERLTELTGSDRVVRVMPNTPALVGAGAGAFAASPVVSAPERETVKALLNGCGLFLELPESQLDAVTGLSGSGPAYVFQFIQALADGGVAAGLTRDAALALAIRTVLGAAQLALESGRHPMELSDMVMSPGGTTAQGVLALYRGGFAATVSDAVVKAAERSKELGGK